MINALNKQPETSSKKHDLYIEITVNGLSFKMDNQHELNKQFIESAKRGNGFNKDTVIEPGTVKAYSALGKKYTIQTAYDIGCQNLYTSFLMEKLIGCYVTSYDLDKNALEAGYKSLELNNSNIKVVNKGIGVDSEQISLNNLDPVDLIMIDVEGYQSKIISDGMPYIKKNRPIFVYETDNTNAIFYAKPDKVILQPLADIGYKFFLCNDHRQKHTNFKLVECEKIPVADGLLVIIPEEKL